MKIGGLFIPKIARSLPQAAHRSVVAGAAGLHAMASLRVLQSCTSWCRCGFRGAANHSAVAGAARLRGEMG